MDSPCQNPKLLELEEKKTLTSEEMQTYLALRKMCEDRMNAAAIEYQLNQSANAHSYFMYQSLLSTVAAVIIVFAIE
jgi:spore maturation protein SpmA